MKKCYTLFILFSLFSIAVSAQYTPQYGRMITITEPHNVAQTDFPVLVELNTQSIVTAGHMQADGDDIRFSLTNTTPIATPLNYFIESGINTANTKIWVSIPTIGAGASMNIYMFYGDAAATGTSSFSSTFPNAIITTGPNVTLTGSQNIGWLEINAADTLFITAGSPLTINAEKIIITGTGAISGLGRGNQAPAASAVGTGIGGGGTSTSAGCGGGSYGGVGGTGGLDAGDVPGVGGPTYGTQTGTDIDMGSSGGTATGVGGHGGGSLTIFSNEMLVDGQIIMNGSNGAAASRGGGGGSGGGVKVHAKNISGVGAMSSKGGNGGVGSTANDSGGGGGGGRIKLEFGTLNGSTQDVGGGVGGPNGGQAPGQPGGIGTVHTATATFPAVVVGPQSSTPLAVELSDFTGLPVKGTVQVNWHTESEKEAREFQVQRSENALDFSTVGKVNANGNTSFRSSYQFIDKFPSTGINYYRLYIIAEDNSATISKTIMVNLSAVRFITLERELVNNVLVIFSSKAETIIMINGSGQYCGTYQVNGRKEIDVSQLASGKYLLKVQGTNEIMSFQKF